MEKTHAPTPRRLRRALEQGDSPISLPMVRGAAFVVFALLVPQAASALAARFRELLQTGLSGPESATSRGIATDVALIAGPLLTAAAVAGLVAGLIQTGAVLTFGERRGGIGATWSGMRLRMRTYEAARGLVVTAALLVVAARSLAALMPRLAAAVSGEQRPMATLHPLAESLLLSVALVMVGASVVDLVVKRAAWRERWRMSARDLREERRDSEGDPEMKRARRRAHEALERPGATRPDRS